MLLLYCDTCGTRIHTHKSLSFEFRNEGYSFILTLCTDCEIVYVKPIIDLHKKVKAERELT